MFMQKMETILGDSRKATTLGNKINIVISCTLTIRNKYQFLSLYGKNPPTFITAVGEVQFAVTQF